MNRVLLTRDGSVLEGRGDPVVNILNALPRAVELDDDFSLDGYFQLLEKHPVLTDLNEFFTDFLERFHQAPPSGERPPSGLDFLEFVRNVEMIGFPGVPRLEIFFSLQAVRGNERLEIKNFSFDSLLDTKIRLGGVKHIVFGDQMDVFEFATVFNLFEFIDGVAWGLSVQGGPDSCAIRR